MKKVLTNCFIEVNAQDISNWVHDVTIEADRDEVEVTGFQAQNKEILMGLGDATITLGVWQDFAAAAIDALLWPLRNTNTPFSVRVRPDAGVKSATNPEYAMDTLLPGYQPIAGSVGEAADITVAFRNATQAGLTRAVA